ncbi:hypothetical protein A5892_15705 [Halotalea alkalilenta]|uniref:FHA domain-containing protein n=2 Tax=Halotalea alkalilenta TaxID=376489 RepID=A0A172YHK3_9GAMM|nr:hypothetical protein A5892_15705 [Halotalea alkalilenta]
MALERIRIESKSTSHAYAVLEVMQGLHQGVALHLEDAYCRIGNAEHADVSLHDVGVAEEHARLRFHARMVAIEAVGGEVGVDGQRLEHGHGQRFTMPVTLTIGTAQLRLTPTDPGMVTVLDARIERYLEHLPPGWRTRFGKLALGALLCMPLALVGAYQLVNAGATSPTASPDSITQPRSIASQSESSPAPAVQALRDYLDQHSLESLALTDSQGRVLVSGRIDQTQRQTWEETQRWFDRHYGDRTVLVSEVEQTATGQPPAVGLQAVWFGDSPYAIDTSGERLYPGATLKDGWVLSRIAEGEVVLQRGTERFTMTL